MARPRKAPQFTLYRSVSGGLVQGVMDRVCATESWRARLEENLRARFEQAMADGEPEVAVLQRSGTPEDVAEAFLANNVAKTVVPRDPDNPAGSGHYPLCPALFAAAVGVIGAAACLVGLFALSETLDRPGQTSITASRSLRPRSARQESVPGTATE